MSFFDWNWGKQFNFVGLDNYLALLGSERFHTALWNTFVFTVGAVAVELAARPRPGARRPPAPARRRASSARSCWCR